MVSGRRASNFIEIVYRIGTRPFEQKACKFNIQAALAGYRALRCAYSCAD
jgi:hypothetical protein